MDLFIDSLKRPLVLIVFFFVCLYIFTRIFGPLDLFTANLSSTNNNEFSVDGTGTASAVPQTATVSVDITKTASDQLTAQQQVNSISNKLISDLKALGIQDKDIKTTNYSSNPNPTYYPVPILQDNSTSQGAATGSSAGPAIIVRPPFGGGSGGYTVDESLQVQAQSTNVANKVIDTATQDGATIVGGIQFTFSRDEQTALENKARMDAISNASQKAQTIAQESGLHLGRLLNVQESNYGGPVPLYEAKTMGSVNPPTQLQPGQNQVSVTVTLTYQTY